MATTGVLPSFWYDNTHRDTHASSTQIINEPDSEEPMEEYVSNENVEHTEAEDEVTYLSLPEYEDFAIETISSESFFLIGANSKYSQSVRVVSRYIT